MRRRTRGKNPGPPLDSRSLGPLIDLLAQSNIVRTQSGATIVINDPRQDNRFGSPADRSKTPFEQLESLLANKNMLRPVELTEDHVLSILTALRARDAIFGANLFSDPAWDLLLELYAAKLGGRRMTLQDVALAIDIPESTTARWATVLKERQLVMTDIEYDDPHRHWMVLTPEGASRMKRLVDHWGSAFLSI